MNAAGRVSGESAARASEQGIEPGAFVAGQDAAEPMSEFPAQVGRTPRVPEELGPLPAWASAIFNAIGEAVGLLDLGGVVVWGNELFRALEPSVQQRVATLAGEQLADAPHAQLLTGVSGIRLNSADESRFFELSLTALGADAMVGAARGRLVAVVRDVTDRRRFEQKMDAIDQAGYELMKLDADVVRKLNQIERLKLLETKIVKYCQDLLSFDHFIIRLLDERSQKLELVMCSGVAPEIVDAFDIRAKPEGNGISGFVAATGKSYICEDTTADELFLPGLVGARSSLTVPLQLNEKVIGILNVESQQPSAFKDSDRQFAEIFARYIAIALNTLGLLVVERTLTNTKIGERVEGEISEPLTDIQREVDVLRQLAQRDPELARHVERILQDVDAIRRRVRECTSGPQTLLGVDRAFASVAHDPVLAGKRILIADDEPKVRRIIGDVLHHYGCDVVVCESGGDAMATLEKAIQGVVPGFDLVLSDIRMPDHNGYEVFSVARRLLKPPPVILMTGFGYDPHHSIVRASQEGLQGVLFKPFQVERLLDEVRKAVIPRA